MRLKLLILAIAAVIFGAAVWYVRTSEGIRITSPARNSTFVLGQEIRIIVEPKNGADLDKVILLLPMIETDSEPPFQFVFTPQKAGRGVIYAVGISRSGERFSDEITVNIVADNAAR